LLKRKASKKWTLFLKTKNDIFDAFCKLAKVIQNKKDLNIVSLRSDHEGELSKWGFQFSNIHILVN